MGIKWGYDENKGTRWHNGTLQNLGVFVIGNMIQEKSLTVVVLASRSNL